jgi:pimeloyl-ACP methyl ester carboxylesterase
VPADSSDSLPIVLVPGLNCSARLYAEQIPALWRFGPVMVADHTRDTSIAAIAKRILAAAPPLFALAGLSMGGYIAFEIMRQAPQRVLKLALMDTGARPETAEQTARRQGLMAMARAGKLIEVADESFVFFCASKSSRRRRTARHGAGHGGGDRRRGVPAPATGHHGTAGFAARTRRHSMSDIDAGR